MEFYKPYKFVIWRPAHKTTRQIPWHPINAGTMFKLYPSQCPILNCLKLGNMKYLMLIMLNVWGSIFFQLPHYIYLIFCFYFLFFSNILLSVYKHLILTMTLTLTFRYKCQQPSQPVTATIELSCENSMLVMRTVLRWIYQNSANTPKVHILIKHYQIHKERGKITL